MRPLTRLAGGCCVVLAALTTVLAAPVSASATPGPSDAPEYWFDRWDVPALWAAGARGQGITIAEIDTGVAKLPQLDGRVLSGTDLGDLGGDGRTDRDDDPFGHGTAMASIMVGRPGPFGVTGLAPGAKVLPIAVPLEDTTESGEPDHLAEAIRYAVDHGARIINMSLGGKRTQSEDTVACDDDEQQAIFYALSKGAVLTAAVGNSGPKRNSVEDPGVCLGVVAVGAVDSSDEVASFSTRQPYVTLTAPGVKVPSLSRVAGEAYSGDGTSQATAITSAALALVWSKFPKLTGSQVVARVLATLDHRRSTPSPAYGYGVLDAGQAVRASVSTGAPNPVATAVAPFLQRYRALKAASAVEPRPAATTPGQPGTYRVGGSPRITGQVELGVALGVAGVLVLLLTGGGFLVRRRRRSSVPPPSAWTYPPLDPVTGEVPVPWQYRFQLPPQLTEPGPGPGQDRASEPPSAERPRPRPPVPPEPSSGRPADTPPTV